MMCLRGQTLKIDEKTILQLAKMCNGNPGSGLSCVFTASSITGSQAVQQTSKKLLLVLEFFHAVLPQ